MSVTGWNESTASRTLAASAGESGFKWQRSFTVQVDDPTTPLLDIINAPGVNLWAPHPEDQFAFAQQFDAKPRGSSMLLYDVTVKYDAAPLSNEKREEQKPGQAPGPTAIPKAVWSGGTKTFNVPFKIDEDLVVVANSAGIPFPDAEKTIYCPTLSVTKPFATLGAANTAMMQMVGAVNNTAWYGGAVGTWLCESGKWAWKIENQGNVQLKYVEVGFEFTYRSGGWNLMLLDIGYQQRVDNSGNPSSTGTKYAPIKGQDGKPVKEPVALNNGVVMDPPPSANSPPHVINGGKGVNPYRKTDFAAVVGVPS